MTKSLKLYREFLEAPEDHKDVELESLDYVCLCIEL